jgi:acyl dehydratase
VSGFRASLTPAAAGNVAMTLYVNGSATNVTCTIAAAQTTCADGTHTAAVSAGDTVAVGVTNASGLLRHVRWSARLAT